MTPQEVSDHGRANYNKKHPLPPLPPASQRGPGSVFYQMEVMGNQAQTQLDRGLRHKGNVPRNRRMDPYSRQESS